jgi:hypothetical protein
VVVEAYFVGFDKWYVDEVVVFVVVIYFVIEKIEIEVEVEVEIEIEVEIVEVRKFELMVVFDMKIYYYNLNLVV